MYTSNKYPGIHKIFSDISALEKLSSSPASLSALYMSYRGTCNLSGEKPQNSHVSLLLSYATTVACFILWSETEQCFIAE